MCEVNVLFQFLKGL